jgi:hypothetical protein
VKDAHAMVSLCLTCAWFHRCARDEAHFVGIGEACNWCGGIEAQEPEPDPVEVDRLVRETYGRE